MQDTKQKSYRHKIVVIGMGNPILGDDGVGWSIAKLVKNRLDVPNSPENDPIPKNLSKVDVIWLAVGGLSLMEHLIGYDRAILIDAITTGNKPPGSVSCFLIDELPNRAAGHLSSAHDTTLHNALQVGRIMGTHLPEHITIVSIESQMVFDFSEELSPPVAAAVPHAVKVVLNLLHTSNCHSEGE